MMRTELKRNDIYSSERSLPGAYFAVSVEVYIESCYIPNDKKLIRNNAFFMHTYLVMLIQYSDNYIRYVVPAWYFSRQYHK